MTDTKLRTIQAFASLATTLAAVVALVALYVNVRAMSEDQLERDLWAWQDTIVYGIIRDDPGMTFSKIQSKYLSAATKYGLSKLPKKSLQDEDLHRILLYLLGNGVIELDKENKYYTSTSLLAYRQSSEQLLADSKLRRREEHIRIKILCLVEQNSGKYTVDGIYTALKDEEKGLEFEMVVDKVGELRFQDLIDKGKEGLLYETYDRRPK